MKMFAAATAALAITACAGANGASSVKSESGTEVIVPILRCDGGQVEVDLDYGNTAGGNPAAAAAASHQGSSNVILLAQDPQALAQLFGPVTDAGVGAYSYIWSPDSIVNPLFPSETATARATGTTSTPVHSAADFFGFESTPSPFSAIGDDPQVMGSTIRVLYGDSSLKVYVHQGPTAAEPSGVDLTNWIFNGCQAS